MKKHMKAAIAIILLIAVMAANGAGVTASASRVSLRVRYGINIRVNGILFQPVDSRGNPVEPFIYAGTTYVPLRAISDLYGADIDWDGSTRTVILDTENAHELRHNGRTASHKQTSSERRITVETGIAIEVNGVKFIPKDSNGNEVTVILYNGTTFVPIRAISGIFGAPVDWEGNSRTVILGTNTTVDCAPTDYNCQGLALRDEINRIYGPLVETVDDLYNNIRRKALDLLDRAGTLFNHSRVTESIKKELINIENQLSPTCTRHIQDTRYSYLSTPAHGTITGYLQNRNDFNQAIIELMNGIIIELQGYSNTFADIKLKCNEEMLRKIENRLNEISRMIT